HRLAGGDSILTREPAGERGDARGQLTPRRLAPDPELLRAKRDAFGARPCALDEQAGQGARAQRFEIHAGRIIPGRVPAARRGLAPPAAGAPPPCCVPASWRSRRRRSAKGLGACRGAPPPPPTPPPTSPPAIGAPSVVPNPLFTASAGWVFFFASAAYSAWSF